MTWLRWWVGLGRLVPVGCGHTGPVPWETSSRAGHYKYTAQSSDRHYTCIVGIIVPAHHPCIQTPHTHGVVHWAAMKTGLSTGCGLSYQPLLPWSLQKNTNTNNVLHILLNRNLSSVLKVIVVVADAWLIYTDDHVHVTECTPYCIVLCLLHWQAKVCNAFGTCNNVITVRSTDFEVFEALSIDSVSTGHTVHHSEFNRLILYLECLWCVDKEIGDVMVLSAGQGTCDSQVVGSRPGWAPLCSASVTNQYNLVSAKGWSLRLGK